MQPIETKEIRGISWRTVRWVIASTVMICMSIAGSYYGIQKRLSDFTNKNMLQDLKIKTNQVGIDINGTKLQRLQERIERNTIEIEKLKSKVK